MVDVVLYEEDTRPYARPPQMHHPSRLRGKSPSVQDQVRGQVVEMFQALQLVLDPLADQIDQVRSRVSMDDLLRKLKWYTVLFEKVVETNIFTDQERATIQGFKKQVDGLLRRQRIHNEDFNPESGEMPVIPITDLLMGVCFDAEPWTTIEDFCKQLAALPLNRWPGMPMWGLSHSLHARVIRMSTKETLFLGSTTEKFPREGDRTSFFWRPLKEWCHEHRRRRLQSDEQAAYGSAFRAYKGALRNANVNHEVIEGRKRKLSQSDVAGFDQVIRQSPMTMLALPTADDVGFAMDAKGMKVKDACARCLAHRFGGSRLLGQRALEESLKADNRGFWTLFSCISCGEIISNAFACRMAREAHLTAPEANTQAAERV